MQEISAEIIGKYKQLCRLLISYNDFKHAADVAHFYMKGDYEVDRVEWDGDDYFERKIIGEAMNSAMIIAYARPFSGNDKAASFKIPDLPKRYFRQLDEKGRQVHELIIKDRNFRMAHSDSRAWELALQVLEIGNGKDLLMLVHEDTRAPLSKDTILTLISNCNIFMDAIIEARKDLEKQLQEYLPKVQVSDDNDG